MTPEPRPRSKAGIVDDTWGAREVPVLSAAVTLLEQSYMVTVSDIAERTGLELNTVARSLDALGPTYVDFRKTETGGDPRFWYVHKVTPAARREVGQWPTPEGLVDRLTAAFSAAADREADPSQQDRLRMAARLLGETARPAAIEVAAAVIGEAGRAEAPPPPVPPPPVPPPPGQSPPGHPQYQAQPQPPRPGGPPHHSQPLPPVPGPPPFQTAPQRAVPGPPPYQTQPQPAVPGRPPHHSQPLPPVPGGPPHHSQPLPPVPGPPPFQTAPQPPVSGQPLPG